MAFDGEQFGNFVVEQVRGYVERATAPLLTRIAELETRRAFDLDTLITELKEHGFAAVDGHVSATDFEATKQRWATQADNLDAANARIREFAERLEAMPIFDAEALAAETEARVQAAAEIAVKAAIAALPAPQAGKDGADAPEVTDDQIDASVARYFEANPPAAGKDGADGKDGRDGVDGQKGADGADGVGLASALIDKDGHLIVTTTRGAVLGLGKVMGVDGRDGERGEPGPPGFSLDDFDLERPDERTLRFIFTRGERTDTFDINLEHPIDRGVYRADDVYERGDGVSFGGSFFIAQRTTTDRPETSDAWRLAVKRGRDGKDLPK